MHTVMKYKYIPDYTLDRWGDHINTFIDHRKEINVDGWVTKTSDIHTDCLFLMSVNIVFKISMATVILTMLWKVSGH